MTIVFWHWLTLGLALIFFEMLAPGTFLLWPGLAAVLTGILAYVAPGLGWQVHALVFAVLAVASAVLGRGVYARLRHSGGQPGLNQRGQRMVGSVLTLVTPIVDGVGRARHGDGTWTVSGPDLGPGERVRVVDVDGIVLKVEKADG